MTFQIRKADLPCSVEEFIARVAAHVERLNEYALHLLGVEADAANPALTPDERRHAFPPPSEDIRVEKAIRPNGEGEFGHCADFEIVGPSLAERKSALTDQVRQAEAAVIVEAMPPAKARHWQFREQDIRAADHMRVANHPAPIASDEVDAWLRAVRPAADTAFLDEMSVRRARVTAVQRHAAKLEHDIDDLTDETVDGFEVTPFNG